MNTQRQLGRTEKMLLDTIEALSESNVAVVAASYAHARELFGRLRDRLGVSGDKTELVIHHNDHYLWIVLPKHVTKVGHDTYELRGRSNVKVYVDHSVFETGDFR